jgi:hypothetical protein
MAEIEKAKQVLRNAGYFVDSLWSIEDVQQNYNCTEEQAQVILEQSLTNEATMEQIWFSIKEFSELANLKEA